MSERACASCGTANEADARFCEGCGTALERTCGTCGVAASSTARFCKACGAPLDAELRPAAEGPTRKTVTVLFADLAGSTAFEEIVDAETAREVIGRYHDLLRSTADRHRAGVTKYIGDGFMAVWGVPEIGADDAEHAVEAAVELQERFVGLASRVAEANGVNLALRVAVNTGEVVVGADDADLVGDALNVGARLESECPHGHVVVGEETWRSTRGRHRYDPLGAVQVKGRTAPVSVYQWLGQLSETADAVPFVGRSTELGRLRRIFDDAVDTRTARLVTVTGDPGVGKTRLAAEFVGGLPGARVIRARCAVEGSPALAPLVEMLRTRDLEADVPAGVAERDRLMRALTGMTAGLAGSVEETFWALRRYVEVLASDGPVVIVVDDIQWADALLIDFVEHLAQWVQGAPVLMVALARSELRETRPDLVTVGGWVSEALRMRGLEARATAELAARVLGSDQLPEELLGRLPLSTGGNPLFVRELVGMLVHDGVLVATPDGWRLTVDVDAIAVPPTIQALLASRLERLNTADRRVLEVAAVVGTDFSPGAVAALAGLGGAEITSTLNRLRRVDLAQPSGTYAGDEPVWRFHHVLIRDVAYRRLLKSDRAELHERLADWVQGGGANVAFESDEVIARHLEAAHGYRLDLGQRDEHTGELALRSARNYLVSARRALDRDELVSAGTQAARGAILAATDSALQAELLLVGCEAFLSAGDVAAGAPLVDDLERIAGEALAPWAICYRCQLVVYTDPTRLPEVDELLQGAINDFARRTDAAGLAKAHRVRANARARMGRVGDCEIDLFEALIAARQCGDHRQITAALGAAPNAALWGPSPAPKAGGRCLDVVRMQRMTTAAPSLEATSLRCLAVLELLRGRPDKARSMLADARQVVADLGLQHGLMETELFAGIIEMMVGDPVAAEPHFRMALEGLDALGVGADAGQAAALLARSVLAQGRVDEADRYAAESERIAGHNLKTAIAWRAVRAEIISAQGQHDTAIAKAREAVAVAADTDLVLDHADACLALSRVLAAEGDHHAAAEARRAAESLYAAKDAVFMVGGTVDTVAHVSSVQPTDVKGARLPVRNRATRTADVGWQGMLAHDADTVVSVYSDRAVYDDHRRLSGDPIVGIDQLREAARRNFAQYPHVEWRPLAVRGETLDLSWARWWDDAGNEATTLHLYQVGDDDLIEYHGRFDEDDFEGAYRELEKRYYEGEGAPFAQNGKGTCAWLEAMWRRDVEAARRVAWPHFRWLASPSALKPAARTVDEFFDWQNERAQQLSSIRVWAATMRWVAPDCNICLSEVRGAGADGEEYRWSRICVGYHRDGLALSVREFDVEDEDAAFAYADSLVARRKSRLVVYNTAKRFADKVFDAMRAGDASAATEFRSKDLVYNDRRRFAGALIADKGHLGAATAIALAQYNHFENRTLAVRGERLWLGWSRWSDDTGNEATHLHVAELGEDGLSAYESFFDEDDFWSAYRELESRYYAGEAAAFATSGFATAGWVEAIGRRDIEAARRLSQPDFRWLAPPTALKACERSVDDMFEWMDERGRQVASQRHWVPVLHWLSPNCAVGLGEIEAVGTDGEEYSWSFIYVGECREGLLATAREFDDEEQAFAYAESLVAGQPPRLPLTNHASEVADRVWAAMRAHDVDAATATWSDTFLWDDRRLLSGDPITNKAELRTGFERIFQQYSTFEDRKLAVRGDRLYLGWTRWSDETGNETTSFHVAELGDDGLIAYAGRFDEDDFDAAYRELERRYGADEGKPYAESATLIEMVYAENRGDLDGAFSVFATPGLRFESRSSSIFPARTAAELRHSVEQLGAMVTSYRVWSPAFCWLSKNWVVGYHEREAVGGDGEKFAWARLYVLEMREGRIASACEFDVDNEDAAFAYAEERMRAATSRLAVSNQASDAGEALGAAMGALDTDRVVERFSDEFIYDDRRPLSGGSIANLAELRAATERIFSQYNHFESRTLAVRGERLSLAWTRWSDDAGNETRYLVVIELGVDGLIHYQARFAEDDFDSAYRELEARYCVGEGAAFAEAGARLAEFVTTLNRGDLDTAFGMFGAADRQIESRSRSVFPDRTATELRGSLDQLRSMVSSVRWWYSALCWLSPDCAVARQEREATGPDGETYAWTQLYAGGFSGDVVLWACEFEVDDEDAAFAYAEERMRMAPSRLAVSNRASEVGKHFIAALRAGGIDTAAAFYSDQVVYDDRRRLTGDPIKAASAVHAAIERFSQYYNRFELKTLAVRGEHLQLAHHRWSDEAGNQSAGLILSEIADDGRVIYDGRFDEDDFDAAYRELEHRYYADEGAEYAANGLKSVIFLAAMDSLDVEAARRVCLPTFRWFSPPSTLVAQERSLDEFFHWLRERADQVSSVRNFCSVIRWLSPECFVALGDVQAQGTYGEEYAWARIYVGELRDGLLASMRQFEDEDAAFDYAEECVRVPATRLALSNRASDVGILILAAMRAHDLDGTARHWADQFVYDDRRRYSGDPLNDRTGLRLAMQRIFKQYSRFESRVLAVRGSYLNLASHCWSDDNGNRSSSIILAEVGSDDRIIYEGRFDEDDFDAAYQELENRYYSGEGSAFEESGNTSTQVVLASNAGDLEKVFGELMARDMRVDSRSGTIFPDRTTGEFRDSVELFQAMVSSARIWLSAIKWLSPNCAVARQEREAVGEEGEKYTWARIYVCEFENGLGTALCDFDPEFEQQAFAYAEERVLAAAQTRLAVRNRASGTAERVTSALRAGDVGELLSCCSEGYFLDDRRRFSGDPLRGHESLRAGAERVLQHFNRFEMHPLAVRGERFALCWLRWSDDSGNESTHLHVIEVGHDNRIAYEVRFDEDDFEGAYQELERRYYAGQGAAFAEPGLALAEYSRVRNRGDIDTLVRDLTAPDLHIESRSHSVFPDRSAAEYRASLEELDRLVDSQREWLATIRWMSPRWAVGLLQREAVGHDGEKYEWSRIVVSEMRNGRLASVCDFDVEDEDAAFAYAEGKVQSESSPLAVRNRASEVVARVIGAMQAGDVDAVLACYSDDYAFDDRRRLSGDPFSGKAALREVSDRILQQFNRFDWRILAVRGDRLSLGWSRWSDDAGNETCHLHVFEAGDEGLVARDIRFDEDDFEGAYRELEARYYAGEGAAFTEYGLFNIEYMAAMNRGDFDTMFNELTSPDLRFENHSRSIFPDRSAEELRANFEDLYAMLASVRSWFSALRWVSPTMHVGCLEREGVGHDGEQFAWTRILVNQYRDGRLVSICEFDAKDADAALAYAEELATQT